MITADQLLCHAIGDYVLQSDWMATEKTKKTVAALVHVFTYALPFLLLKPSVSALLIIISTHFVIDRWRLARFVVRLKNLIGDGAPSMSKDYATATGYPADTPAFLAVWLLIITDNIMHVVINGLALRFL